MSHKSTAPASPDLNQEAVSFSSLPNEVISKIFLAGTEIWANLEPLRLPFHILVSGVCAHWRILSQSTPELWTFILPPLRKDPDECLHWTTIWLQRSGAMLVSVVLDDGIVDRSASMGKGIIDQLIFRILGLVSNQVHRLRRIDIRTRSSSTFEAFIGHLSKAYNLRQISLWARHPQPNEGLSFTTLLAQPESSKWSPLQSLPSLAKFRCRNISLPYNSNLTSLHVYRLIVNYEDVKTIFTTSRHLNHLVLYNLLPIRGSIPTQYTPIPAPSLRSIAVSHFAQIEDIVHSIFLFKLMVIPNLVYLEIDGNVQTSAVFGSSLSSSKIKTLRISNFTRFSFGSQIYHSFSSLQHLELIQVPARQLLLYANSQIRPLTRPRSINFGKPSYRNSPLLDGRSRPQNNDTSTILATPSNITHSSPPDALWPELRSIALDTFAVDDLLAVVDFVKGRKGHIQSFLLSNSAMRHLSESLTRIGDEIVPLPSGHLSFRLGSANGQGIKDVREWLNKLVTVELLRTPSYGLLDADRVPLTEML